EKLAYSEYDGVDVISGGCGALAALLDAHRYNTVLVHFLDKDMWSVLGERRNLRKLVWVHGAEVQPWYRREYNYSSEAEIERAKVESAARIEFWRRVLFQSGSEL